MIFRDIFALFLAQNFKTKVRTAHKNLLLECMLGRYGCHEYFDIKISESLIIGLAIWPQCNNLCVTNLNIIF